MGEKLSRIGLAIVLALSLGLAACDKEDERDVQEGVNDVQEGVEDVGNDVEDAVDDADSDGKDDK